MFFPFLEVEIFPEGDSFKVFCFAFDPSLSGSPLQTFFFSHVRATRSVSVVFFSPPKVVDPIRSPPPFQPPQPFLVEKALLSIFSRILFLRLSNTPWVIFFPLQLGFGGRFLPPPGHPVLLPTFLVFFSRVTYRSTLWFRNKRARGW